MLWVCHWRCVWGARQSLFSSQNLLFSHVYPPTGSKANLLGLISSVFPISTLCDAKVNTVMEEEHMCNCLFCFKDSVTTVSRVSLKFNWPKLWFSFCRFRDLYWLIVGISSFEQMVLQLRSVSLLFSSGHPFFLLLVNDQCFRKSWSVTFSFLSVKLSGAVFLARELRPLKDSQLSVSISIGNIEIKFMLEYFEWNVSVWS